MKRHCLLQDTFSKKTLSVLTVSVETLLVVRHFLFLSKKTLSVMRYFQFSDTCSCQTQEVVRHLQFSDACSFQTLAVVRHFQLSDILHYETLSVTNLPISVSWVMEFPTYRYKTSLILSKKCHGLQDKYCVL